MKNPFKCKSGIQLRENEIVVAISTITGGGIRPLWPVEYNSSKVVTEFIERQWQGGAQQERSRVLALLEEARTEIVAKRLWAAGEAKG